MKSEEIKLPPIIRPMLPILTKLKIDVTIGYEIVIGEYRLIPKGTTIWSINNQTTFILAKDEIVKISAKCIGNYTIFVSPIDVLFNMIGFIPTPMPKGKDEWSVSYEDTIPYEIPKYQAFEVTYNK